MKFLVLGHFCFDSIHPKNEPEIRSYGGIYYPVATLATLLDENDSVIPVFGVNASDYAPLLQHLKQFPNVDPSGIYQFDEPTNNVHFFFNDKETRVECSKDISKPIPFEKIKPYVKVDGVLVNMISGSDISVNTLDELRMAVREANVPMHFDYHSLTMGVREDHERYRRPVVDWRRWVFMTDTVQLNEEEIAGLTIEKSTEQQTVGHLLTLSVKGVVVTRGERGVSVFSNDHKKVVRHDIDGLNVQRSLDAIGCGDVFGAAFHMKYVKTKDLVLSAEFANKIAAAKAGMVGSAQIRTLRDVK